MAQYTVTASTSVVIINSLATPYTTVLLSSVVNPGHIVGIRDGTGSALIRSQPIVVSTTNGVYFFDKTFSTVITEPYGSVSVSSKDPSTWQLLNNAGFFTSLSNVYLSTLSSQKAFVNQVSSIIDIVSTSVIGNIAITNSIFLGGNTNISGDITVTGDVDFLQTMGINGQLSISSGLIVGDAFTALSSVTVLGNLVVGGFMSTQRGLFVEKSLNVDQNIEAYAALVPKYLSVQTLQMDTVQVGGGIQSAYDIATESNAYIGQDMLSLGSTTIGSTLSVKGETAVYGGFYSDSAFFTKSLSTGGFVTIGKDVSVEGAVTARGAVSTLGSTLFTFYETGVKDYALLQHDVNVTGISQLKVLRVGGNATISSIGAFSTALIQGGALSHGSTFTVGKEFEILGNLAVGGSLLGSNSFVSMQGGVSTFTDLGVGENLVVGRELSVRGNLAVQYGVSGVSTLRLGGSLSTTTLSLRGDVTVLSEMYIPEIVGASTLGAPIDLSISTLTLSNTLYVTSWGKVPLLDIHNYPSKIIAGDATISYADVNVGGILNNRSTVDQTSSTGDTKLWYATQVRASTILANTLVSSLLIGPATDTKPFQTFYGAVVTGQLVGSNNLMTSSNISTNYVTTSSRFTGATGGYKVAYNGSNQWVAVGDSASAIYSILTSSNGYTWSPPLAGGLNSQMQAIAYGGGIWVALGYSTGITIQYSTDGLNWSAATGAFSGGGNDVAYNGSNLWVATGGTSAGNFGMRYSLDGMTWTLATLIPSGSFNGKGVGFGGGRWLASDGLTQLITSVDGSNWIPIAQTLGKTTFAYNGSSWIAGGPATGGNPTTSIHTSPDGLTWTPITSGGFLNACYDIQWDSVNMYWLATGDDTNVLQYSVDGVNWLHADSSLEGIGRGIAVGTISAPDTNYYFTVNMTSILRSTLSSVVLYASTVNVSSLQSASLFGDGAGLSNINSFRSSVYASSFFGVNGYSLDISAQKIQTQSMVVKDTLTVIPNPFLSSIELWIAAGYDSEINGNIQTSYTGLNWSRTIGPSFDYYAKAVAGNSNISSPLYVAVGADSRTEYTIQWSDNARNWFPITSGGFEALTSGIRKGNSVAYNSNISKWVAAGNNEGTRSTLFYSGDARNWFCANNAFSNVTNFVAASPTGFLALGDSIKYSGDGINWSDTVNTSLALDTVAFGLATYGPYSSYVWVGTSNTTIYISDDNGYTWQAPGYTTLANIASLVYGGSNWVGVGSNTIQYSSNTQVWSNVTTSFADDVTFNAVAYNSNQGRWVAGAVSTTADKSLWSSSNLQTWNPAITGGFSTSISGYGAGYSVFTSSTYSFVAGKAAYSGITPVEQAILQLYSNGSGSYATSNSLTMTNASNVFQNEVRSIYGTANVPFQYVAVGEGEVPQKTIGRSVTGSPGSWIPAVTGGFSTVGYGVTYFGTNWIAVGDAQTSLNTIQYSPDGANWFGTNTTTAMNEGGRGIGTGVGALANTLIAVGKDSAKSTIIKSTDGYAWSPAIGSYFTVQGNAVAGGSNNTGANFVAVGQDARGYASTILQSQNGLTWYNVATGGFTGAGYGVAYGSTNTSMYTYVAVGYDVDSNKTIQYSTDGGNNFAAATSGAFTRAGYGVGFNTLSNLFFAVGEDVIATRNATIKYSGDGINWSNVSTGSGFLSQTTLGAAFGLYTQQVLNTQLSPYIEFSNLVFYESAFPILYPKPTVRIQSTFLVVSESMYMNTSSQMIINSNVPFSESTVMTVYGNIYTSSLIYTGPFIPTDTLYVSSLNVSTLSSFNMLESHSFTTPSLAVNTPVSKANYISSFYSVYSNAAYGGYFSTSMLNINGALYATADIATKQKTGIYLSSPLYDLDVRGILGTSSLSTAYVFAPTYIETPTTGEYIRDSYLTMYSGNEGTSVNSSNLFFTTPSSFSINNVLHFNLSSQKVGIYTQNPQFTLDVRSQTYVQSVSTPLLNTSLLFLTLQSA